MTSDEGRPLPKFGEWDVNDPATSEGFTVIFSKARDEKKASASIGHGMASQRVKNISKREDSFQYPPLKKWFCCF